MKTGPVLALDLASTTGACVGAGYDMPDLMHVRLGSMGEHGGRYFYDYRKWLLGVIELHKPTLLVFEAPILPGVTNLRTTRALQGLTAHTEEMAFRRRIECREISVREVKRGLTGAGNATKDRMMAVACQYGLDPAVHDEADAFGVWVSAIRQLRPEHAQRWDFPIRGAAA